MKGGINKNNMSIKENIIAAFQRRIQKNSVASTMTWTDQKGTAHEEYVITKRSTMPLVGDWNRIYPPINEDDSINWMNVIFGGKRNFFKLLGIMIILACLYFWVTGILGANAEYMNGQNYVIIARDDFFQFCNQAVEIINPYNVTQQIDLSNVQLNNNVG